MSLLKDMMLNIGVRDIIDIFLVAFAIYKMYILIKETRAEQLLKGIFVILLLTNVSKWLELYTTNWILEKAMTVGVIAILIVFQPELRRALEYIGRTKFLSKSFIEIKREEEEQVIDEIIEAVASLSRQKIGALIILERETGLNEVVETGTKIEGNVSSSLLINIFIPNTPLHDGAVILKEDIIKAAACLLPLSENMHLNKELGTRHRAAIGISEMSDCVAIVVSEETGGISVAERGRLRRYLDVKSLKNILMKTDDKIEIKQNFIARWRNKNEK
ncbi:diadenylate cyclase CdaA [Abyssisolibacter fermentans]|uniref:diadenylate cyclase CdaA n=1 Tax=Abyssisolibacter fermentans TaxID=1766203 RepID=UPI00082E874B|nr:diadenylate cyclase CdaA [Abyssisolibacter fermentans]